MLNGSSRIGNSKIDNITSRKDILRYTIHCREESSEFKLIVKNPEKLVSTSIRLDMMESLQIKRK